VLRRNYGLGSALPYQFALSLVNAAGLQSACPGLFESQRLEKEEPTDLSLQQKTQAALDA